MTENEARALAILNESPRWPEEFYTAMWPGRVARRSSYGGPSNEAKAASWYLGRLKKKGWCYRADRPPDKSGTRYPERWTITPEGRAALRQASGSFTASRSGEKVAV